MPTWLIWYIIVSFVIMAVGVIHDRYIDDKGGMTLVIVVFCFPVINIVTMVCGIGLLIKTIVSALSKKEK